MRERREKKADRRREELTVMRKSAAVPGTTYFAGSVRVTGDEVMAIPKARSAERVWRI